MQVHANGGILSESEYPYAAGTSGAAGKCRTSDPSVQPAVTITGYVDLPASAAGQLIDEEELRAMVAERPAEEFADGVHGILHTPPAQLRAEYALNVSFLERLVEYLPQALLDRVILGKFGS